MHCDKNGVPLSIGKLVEFPNMYGKMKHGQVMEILPTCIKVQTSFAYYDHGELHAGEGVFPVVPAQCHIVA